MREAMLRNVVLAVFIVPKVVVWPLLWYVRCRRKRCRLEKENAQSEQQLYTEPDTIL